MLNCCFDLKFFSIQICKKMVEFYSILPVDQSWRVEAELIEIILEESQCLIFLSLRFLLSY
jgi:hypothetical protein